MYARVTTLNLNTEKWDQLLAAINTEVPGLVSGVSGIRSFTIIGNHETGKGTVVAVFESEGALDAATDQINQELGGFGTFFSTPPTVEVGDVLFYQDHT
jgi:hypothetical protein